MIITHLSGGLGNQLFQYAMGRSLSIKNNVDLKLDVSFFEHYQWHKYSLDPFSIVANIATKQECDTLKSKHNLISSKIYRIFSKKWNFRITEKSLEFQDFYKYLLDPVYIQGYWQTEKYFKEYSNILRQELAIKIPPSPANQEILNAIRSTNSISLHIRRGNYVNIPEVNEIHGVCSLQYYQEATNYIYKKIENPFFYVFSDDIEWAKINLSNKGLNFIFIDLNDSDHDYEDLRLMQNCHHHIIANSTFSWWGAWLNPSNEKIVVAPKQWFADKIMNEQSSSIIPEKWIRI